MYKLNFRRKPNKVNLLITYWDNLIKDLEFLSLGFRKDKLTHLLLPRIKNIPTHVRRAALEYYVFKCTQTFHIAFYQWRSHHSRRSNQDLLK